MLVLPMRPIGKSGMTAALPERRSWTFRGIMSCGIVIWIETPMFSTAPATRKSSKKSSSGGKILVRREIIWLHESFKEWNWSYGWNDLGEGKRENELGTVPAQEYPTHINQRSSLSFADPDYGYKPLKESEIVAPSDMFIIGDRPGFY